jgi:single-strand DNA-binding protein
MAFRAEGQEMNQVILIGNLGKDPELRYTQSQKPVATFSIATSEGKDDVAWHNIVVWEKQAENAHKFLKKGSKCAVSGSIKYRSYEDKQGQKKFITEIVAYRVEFLSAPQQQDRIVPPSFPSGEDFDVPF